MVEGAQVQHLVERRAGLARRGEDYCHFRNDFFKRRAIRIFSFSLDCFLIFTKIRDNTFVSHENILGREKRHFLYMCKTVRILNDIYIKNSVLSIISTVSQRQDERFPVFLFYGSSATLNCIRRCFAN